MSYVNFGIPLFHTHQHLSLIYRWNVLYTIWFHHIFQELASNAIYWRFLTTNNFFLKENYSRKSSHSKDCRLPITKHTLEKLIKTKSWVCLSNFETIIFQRHFQSLTMLFLRVGEFQLNLSSFFFPTFEFCNKSKVHGRLHRTKNSSF